MNIINSFRGVITPFIFEVTVLAGESYTLPFKLGEVYDLKATYGDGGGTKTITTYNDADATNTYTSAGTYTITIWGQMDVFDGTLNSVADKLKVTKFKQWGDTQNRVTVFRYLTNMVYDATDTPIESNASPHVQKFRDCDSLGTIANINDWDFTGSCDTMFYQSGGFDMDFSGCDFSGLTSASLFLAQTGFSTVNWDLLLISLDGQALQSGVTIDVGTAKYSAGAAATARANIISTYSWTILDGGAV